MSIIPRLSLILVLAAAATAAEPLRVLFIGNSLTGTNDLPGTVAAMAKARGKAFAYDTSIQPGRTLKEHWLDQKQRSLKKIASQAWDHVVLQDLSSQPLTAPGDLVTYGTLFSEAIAKHGAKTAWFMTWAGRNHPGDQPVFTKAYGDLSVATTGTLVPVGVAWGAFAGAERQRLFPGSDQKHPSISGTYLSACVFHAVLFQESPVGLPAELSIVKADGKPPATITLTAEQALAYQQAAWTAVQGAAAAPAAPAAR